MPAVIGFVYTVLVLPAAYAAVAYIGTRVGLWSRAGGEQAPTVSLLVWLVLAVPGIGKWWDVWVRPGPKMGVPWETPPPGEYVVRSATGNGIALVVLAGASLLLKPMMVNVWLLLFLLVVTAVAFTTPRASGEHSGHSIR